jgi:hypothetical protein
MSDQPLRPFSPPTELFARLHLTNSMSPGQIVIWLLYSVFAFWAVYTIVAVYHWLKYSHASSIAFPAIILHLFISIVLMAYALGITL